MPAQLPDWTVEMVHALPDDGNRYEVVDGELLVTPAPSRRHQRAVLELAILLKPYASLIGLEVMIAPAAVTFSPRREVQPDLQVMRLVNGKPAERFEDVGQLELAVEVLSPSTARADRYTKRELYQSEAVSEYWIVDAESRLVERWRPNDAMPDVLLASLVWAPVAGREPLTIDLEAYFREVIG